MKYTLPVQYDPVTEEHYIQLSEEMLQETGWKIEDSLVWTDNKDGSYTLTKKDDK
jgi:hypothetical protein